MEYPILDDPKQPNACKLVYRTPEHPFNKNNPKLKIAEDICKETKIIDPWNRKKDESNTT
jgi:ribosomal protein S4